MCFIFAFVQEIIAVLLLGLKWLQRDAIDISGAVISRASSNKKIVFLILFFGSNQILSPDHSHQMFSN